MFFDEGKIIDITKSSLKHSKAMFVLICNKTGLPNITLGQIVGNKIKAVIEEVLTAKKCYSKRAATLFVAAISYLEEISDNSKSLGGINN